ncbi:hypothetical protein E2I00_019892, partial [Balaenoptera physalus]
MSRTSQPFFNGAHSGVLPSYEMLKEEQEVAVLGAPQSQAPVTTTVINIRSETSVPDHIGFYTTFPNEFPRTNNQRDRNKLQQINSFASQGNQEHTASVLATGTLTHCPRGGPLSWTREVQPLGVVVTLQHPAAAGTRRRRQRAGSPRSQTSCPGTADNQDRRESSRRQGRRGRRLPGVFGEALPLTPSF